MKNILLLILLTLGLNGISNGQDLKKNQLEVNRFHNRASNSMGSEFSRASGFNFVYTRYLLQRLNISAGYGFGEFYGSGSELLDRFESFPEMNRNYQHFQLKLGYDLIQTKDVVFGLHTEYMRNYYNGVDLRITVGEPGSPEFKERLSFGRIATPRFFTGVYLLAKLHGQIYLKGEASYGLADFNYNYELLQLSAGIAFKF